MTEPIVPREPIHDDELARVTMTASEILQRSGYTAQEFTDHIVRVFTADRSAAASTDDTA